MAALFTPLLFVAHAGTVHFEGRPMSDFTATRAAVAIRRACLNAPNSAAWIYHVAHEQLLAAQAQAQSQSGNPSPIAAARQMGVDHSYGALAASAHGRESN